ncbi:MAG: hypothetical protein ACK5O8_15120 [Pirellula sp.]
MSNQGDDLNHLDLGLPEFQAPEPDGSSVPTPNPSAENPNVSRPQVTTSASKKSESTNAAPLVSAPNLGNPSATTPQKSSPAKGTAPSASTSKSGATTMVSNAKTVMASKGGTVLGGAAKAVGSPGLGKQDRTSNLSSASTVIASTSDSTTALMSGVSQEEEANENDGQHKQRSRGFWSAAPSWLISTVVHVAAILALAAWNIEPIQKELKLMLTVGEPAGDEDNSLEEFAIDNATAEIQTDPTEEMAASAPTVEPTVVDTKVNVDMSSIIAAAPAVAMPSASQSLAPSSGIAAQSNAAMRAALSSRSKETKRELLKKFGGTSETERAVSMALKWLAEHQNPETGAWTMTHALICGGKCDRPGERVASMNAATGMALMCFLGAGQTHMEGEYKETVFKGLSFLINSMRVQGPYGAWWVGDGHGKGLDDMYAHGIASIAMCEAYGMTRDERLLEAAQLSINYMAYAQNPTTGGWHYSPFPIGFLPGDLSVVGWQMMAIKSGAMAGLNFDLDVVRKANVFLDNMQVPGGFGYHYSMDSKMKNPTDYRPAMTACGVLCRMYSGWSKQEPTIKAAAEKFAADGPSPTDNYYNYYATQVMKQYGGAEWDAWNNKMRDQIVSTQVQTGHGAGSWYVEDGISAQAGGRLYCTCMSTMMLEVYYRYMPLYAEQAEEDAFQL